MDQILQKIYEIGIIPVIAIDNADKAVPLARALVKGGLPAAEVTFRTAAGEEAIRRIAAEVPEVLVGRVPCSAWSSATGPWLPERSLSSLPATMRSWWPTAWQRMSLSCPAVSTLLT